LTYVLSDRVTDGMFRPNGASPTVNPYGIGPFQSLQLFNRCARFKFLQSQDASKQVFFPGFGVSDEPLDLTIVALWQTCRQLIAQC
jgi:hypothetical protein